MCIIESFFTFKLVLSYIGWKKIDLDIPTQFSVIKQTPNLKIEKKDSSPLVSIVFFFTTARIISQNA